MSDRLKACIYSFIFLIALFTTDNSQSVNREKTLRYTGSNLLEEFMEIHVLPDQRNPDEFPKKILEKKVFKYRIRGLS